MAAFYNSNLAILELVAQALGPVCDNVIFVGGCATGLLLTQERPDRIRITAPLFIGTKLEAFKDRGKDAHGKPDYLGSHDLEDIVTVVDRRPELLRECVASAPELRTYLAAEFTALFVDPEFEQALAGHLPGDAFSQQRAKPLAQTLRELSKLTT